MRDCGTQKEARRALLRRASFLVAVPVPRFDRRGRSLPRARVDESVRRIASAFSIWFGGARVLTSLGGFRSRSGVVVIDEEEPAVVAMTSRAEYRRRKAAAVRLVHAVGIELDQEAMALLACATEGFVVYRRLS